MYGVIGFKAADPNDLMAFDFFYCNLCTHSMASMWYTSAYDDWIAERYIVEDDLCECGSAKALGIKPFAAGHAWYCPVYHLK